MTYCNARPQRMTTRRVIPDLLVTADLVASNFSPPFFPRALHWSLYSYIVKTSVADSDLPRNYSWRFYGGPSYVNISHKSIGSLLPPKLLYFCAFHLHSSLFVADHFHYWCIVYS